MSIYTGVSEIKEIYLGEGIKDYSAIQGPCPDGFHIPTTEDWGQFQEIYKQLVPSGDRDKSLLLFPAKHKLMEAGSWNGSVAQNIKVTEYDDLCYRSCNSVSLTQAYGFFVSSNGYPQPTNYKYPKGRAQSIRGFRNAPIVPDSSRNVLYQGSGSAGIYHNSGLGVISLSNDGSTRVTIADKDLGASSIQGQGYLFQWGNNYGGFNRNVGTYTSGYSSTAIDAGSYGPGNYYSGNTPIFVYGSPGYYWDNSNNGNLRGGVTGVVKKGGIKEIYVGTTKVRPKPRTFTISWTEQSNMSSGWTYSDDAAGLTAGSGDFDDFFGYSAVLLNTSGVETAEMTQSGGVFSGVMSTLGTISGGDNVMIKFPVRGIKMTKSGSVVTLSITEELNKSGYQYYAFCTGTLSSPGTPKDAFYLGAYEGCNSSSVLKSWSGQTPDSYETNATYCTRAKANGSGYNIIGFYQRMYVNALYMMKYGNPNSQTVIGMGYTGGSAKVATGGTDSQTSATYGTSSYTVQCKLFGLEDRWGNINERLGGVYKINGSNVLYTRLSGYNGDITGGSSTGITITNSSGCMSAISGENKAMFAGTGVISNSSYNTYYSDGIQRPVQSVFYVGGSYGGSSSGTRNSSGIFRTNGTSKGTSYANVGTRLMYLNGLT